MRKRTKKHDNDNAFSEFPSKTNSKRRGRGRRVEKESMKMNTGPKPIDEIKFNRKVMENLEKSGAINYLVAGMFTQLSVYANQRRRKRFLITSDFKSCIKPKDRNDDYSDDNDDDNVQERNRVIHLIASRIVYEYLIDHQLKLTKYALQNETKNDKAFSSKTPASFSPLQLGDASNDDEDNNQKSETIKKIIIANKNTEMTLKPSRRKDMGDDEIVFNVPKPKPKPNSLKRKNSLNSDFSLPSINSVKHVKVSESEDSNPSLQVKDEEEEERAESDSDSSMKQKLKNIKKRHDDIEIHLDDSDENPVNSDEYNKSNDEDQDNINERFEDSDHSDNRIKNNEEESQSDSDSQIADRSMSTPESTPKSKSKDSHRLPSTTSPKKTKSPSLIPKSSSKAVTPGKFTNTNSNDFSPVKTLSLSSSNFDLDEKDDIAFKDIKWPKPQTPTHAKNEVDTNDISVSLENPNFAVPNLDPVEIAKSSSQAIEALQKQQQSDYSQDSLNLSSGSEHELQAENEYTSDLEND